MKTGDVFSLNVFFTGPRGFTYTAMFKGATFDVYLVYLGSSFTVNPSPEAGETLFFRGNASSVYMRMALGRRGLYMVYIKAVKVWEPVVEINNKYAVYGLERDLLWTGIAVSAVGAAILATGAVLGRKLGVET